MPEENLTIEKNVLAAIILNEKCRIYLDKLDEIDFKEPQNKKLFALLRKMHEKDKPIDIVSVAEAFKNATYITEVTESYISADNIEEHYRELKSRGIRRQIFIAAKKIAEMAEKIDDGLEAKNNALQILSDIEVDAAEEEDDRLYDVLSKTMAYIEQKYYSKDEGTMLTPFADLNAITGGFHEQELTVVAARPGMGKTAIALQICEYLAKNKKNAVFISREMSKTQLGIRLYARETDINSWNLRTGHIKEDDFDKIAKAFVPMSSLPIRVNVKVSTIQEIRAYCRELKTKNLIDILVIDYLQLLKTTGKFGNREQEVASMSRDLKLMANEFNIPVILLAQLNRGAEQRRPILSDLRESGAIEQDADNVLFLYEPGPDEIKRDDVLRAGLELRKRGNRLIELILAKQRNGPVGTIYLEYEPGKTRFKNLALGAGGRDEVG